MKADGRKGKGGGWRNGGGMEGTEEERENTGKKTKQLKGAFSPLPPFRRRVKFEPDLTRDNAIEEGVQGPRITAPLPQV